MKIPKEELAAVLISFNPWWRKENMQGLPTWQRSAFHELLSWILDPPVHRAIMLSGARQVGKTTLLLQAIEQLLSKGVPPSNVLYATFDHPILKFAGHEAVLEAWREIEPKAEGMEYLFLDEAQFIKDFGTWTKHQIDFSKNRRIIFTGSAMPLIDSGDESGVGRWLTLQLSTLSFYEYLQIKRIALPDIPTIGLLSDLFTKSHAELHGLRQSAQDLIAHFHEYLVRGGFPQTALVENIQQAQRLLREDVIDKVLKRDMTALFGVRRVLELEQTFIYLCMHDGGIQDMKTLTTNLGVNKNTVQNFISLLEAAHLLQRLPPYGYGKEILRARYKYFLTDPAMPSAILMKGKTILEDPAALGQAVETAVFSHLRSHTSNNHARFSYWKDAKSNELDLVVEISDVLIPLEVKYESQIAKDDVQGLLNFCSQKNSVRQGYIVTKSANDFGLFEVRGLSSKIMRIPACMLCYWLGESEIRRKNLLVEVH